MDGYCVSFLNKDMCPQALNALNLFVKLNLNDSVHIQIVRSIANYSSLLELLRVCWVVNLHEYWVICSVQNSHVSPVSGQWVSEWWTAYKIKVFFALSHGDSVFHLFIFSGCDWQEDCLVLYYILLEFSIVDSILLFFFYKVVWATFSKYPQFTLVFLLRAALLQFSFLQRSVTGCLQNFGNKEASLILCLL